jgi:hypothetical protein
MRKRLMFQLPLLMALSRPYVMVSANCVTQRARDEE